MALLKFLVALIDVEDMHAVTKLFFVPVGLPGMGKSTLAKNIRNAIANNLAPKSSQLPDRDGSSNLHLESSQSRKQGAIDLKISSSEMGCPLTQLLDQKTLRGLL